MMKKKDYEVVAMVLGGLPLTDREIIVSRMAEALSQFNPHFDRVKFAASASLLACENCFKVSSSPTHIGAHKKVCHKKNEVVKNGR